MISWFSVVLGILLLGFGGYKLSRGADGAPAGMTQEAAMRLSRLMGFGYIFCGFTFLFAAGGSTIVWALLCMMTAVVAIILFVMSLSTRKAARSSTQ